MRGVARKRRLTAMMSSAAAGATNERPQRFQRLTTPLRLRVLADPHRAWQSSRCLDYTDEQLQQEFSLSRRGLLRRRTTAHLFPCRGITRAAIRNPKFRFEAPRKLARQNKFAAEESKGAPAILLDRKTTV
jgi:hypothetical protein